MAIHETPREDLLRDGKGFLSRGEIILSKEKIVIGFRRRDQVAIYCGEDPVFQFNADLALRRVYFDGVVYRAEGGLLIRLVRTSRGGRVVFDSVPVSEVKLQEILDSLGDCLRRLRLVAGEAEWKVVGEDLESFRKRLNEWLGHVNDRVVIAKEAGVQ